MSNIKKYEKKRVQVRACLWTGDNLFEVETFIHGKKPENDTCEKSRDGWDEYIQKVAKDGLHINTLEGVMSATIGDYIIEGIEGENYPCKPAIFKKTYSELKDQRSFDEKRDDHFLGHIKTKKQIAIQSLNALFLEVEEDIANDIKNNVMAAFDEIEVSCIS